ASPLSALHSFPTRRSSDLPSLDITACGSPCAVFVNNAAYLVNTDVYFDGRKHYADGGTEPRLRFYGLAARHWQLNSGLRDLVLRSEEHTSELQSLAYLVCR